MRSRSVQRESPRRRFASTGAEEYRAVMHRKAAHSESSRPVKRYFAVCLCFLCANHPDDETEEDPAEGEADAGYRSGELIEPHIFGSDQVREIDSVEESKNTGDESGKSQDQSTTDNWVFLPGKIHKEMLLSTHKELFSAVSLLMQMVYL